MIGIRPKREIMLLFHGGRASLEHLKAHPEEAHNVHVVM